MRESLNTIKLSLGTIRFMFILNNFLIFYILVSQPSFITFNIWIISIVQYFMSKNVLETIAVNPEIIDYFPNDILN
jgi:hypothetical protein